MSLCVCARTLACGQPHCCCYCTFSLSSSTTEYTEEETPVGITPADDGPASMPQPSGEGDLLGDLLNLDLPTAPAAGSYNAPMVGGGADLDLLTGDLSGLYLGGPSGAGMISAQPQGAIQTGGTGGLGALAELFGASLGGGSYVAPKQVWREGFANSRPLFCSLASVFSLLTALCSPAYTSSLPLVCPHLSSPSPLLTSPPLPILLRHGWKPVRARVWRSEGPGLAGRV